MPKLIPAPTRITAAGNKPKLIDEFIGRVNSNESRLSVARMRSPSGWVEPGQTPEFDEFTLVLRGSLRVTHKDGALDVLPGQAVIVYAGEWVQYSTPHPEGAEYRRVSAGVFAGHRASRLVRQGMLTQEFALWFADEWIQAWNSRDLEGVLGHHAADVELTSPFVPRVLGLETKTIHGLPALRDYFCLALSVFPELVFVPRTRLSRCAKPRRSV